MLVLRHIRTRRHRSKSSKQPKQLLDYICYTIAFVGPVMTVPQIYDIWIRHDYGINVITWGSFMLFAAIWLYYGIVHRARPVVVSNLLWLLAEGLVVLGSFMPK